MTEVSLSSNNSRVAAAAGLGVAFGGTILLVSPVAKLLGDPQRLSTRVLYQLALWALFASIVAIVILWERRSLDSIGLGRLSWASIGLGFGCTAFIIVTLLYLWRRDLWACIIARIEVHDPEYAKHMRALATVQKPPIEDRTLHALERIADALTAKPDF